MKILNKLERRFGRYAIENLTLYIILTYVLGYILYYLTPNIYSYLLLEPSLILRGQVWRVVSWLLIPPGSASIFTIIMLFFYYSLGTSLERTWGAFRYNVYIFGGIILTVIGAFVLYFVLGSGSFLLNHGGMFSTYYISMSIFLAFAAEYPNEIILLYFVIPLKIKWLAWLDVAYLLYTMVQSGWVTRAAIICSLLNFIIFFFAGRKSGRRTFRGTRQRSFGSSRRREGAPDIRILNPNTSNSGITKHKCAICGRTERDGDELEFRFCSQCQGNYEYCQEHLFNHTHISGDNN